MKTKICHYCENERRISDFNTNKRTRDGYDKKCLYCYAEKNGMSYDDYVWHLLCTGRIISDRNRDGAAAAMRAINSRNNNPDRFKQQQKAYRDRNPVIVRENARKSTARRKQREIAFIVNDLTDHDWKSIKNQFNQSCAYCGCPDCKLTMDHVIPVSRGGQNTKDNIVPACRSCNSKKGTKMLEEVGMKIRVTP